MEILKVVLIPILLQNTLLGKEKIQRLSCVWDPRYSGEDECHRVIAVTGLQY